MASKSNRPAAAADGADELPARVLRRFRIVFNAVRNHFRMVESKAGVSGAQVWALGVLAERPGIGVSELARAMRVHQSTASNLLRVLVDGGLVSSRRTEADRRAVELFLTPRGRRVLAKAPQPLTGLLPLALGRLDPATLARLGRDLGRLVRELGVEAGGEDVLIGASPEEEAAEREAPPAPARRPRSPARRPGA
jgi:DNA-binding MarR family transcriptional regulator